MFRNVLGSLLALIGAAVVVWSPFRAWYGGRHGSDIRVDDLFTGVGVTPARAALLGSLFLPMTFAALLTLLGVLLRSRFLVATAGLLVLAVTTLWMVRQAQFSGALTAGGNGLDYGVANAYGGAFLILIAVPTMPGRHPRTHTHLLPPEVPPLDRTQPLPYPPEATDPARPAFEDKRAGGWEKD
jgi:hypothetical protein